MGPASPGERSATQHNPGEPFPDRCQQGKAGRPWKDHRPLVKGILWHLHTGTPWPDTP